MSTPTEAPKKLPIDLPTIFVGVWRMRWFMLIGLSITVAAGVYLAKTKGSKSYEAETSILFTAQAGTMAGGIYRIPDLTTYLHMVLHPDVLATVQERLHLPNDPEVIARSTEARIQKKTDILFLKATWDTAEGAATMANTLRDAFFDLTVKLRTDEAVRHQEALMARLEKARAALKDASSELERYAQESGLIDLDKEAQWLLDQKTALEIKVEENRMEQRSVDLQLAGLEEIMGELKSQIEKEKAQTADMEGIGTAKTKSDRLREKINERRNDGANRPELVRLETELSRKKSLLEKGLIPQEELDAAQAAYDAQLARTVDDEDIETWKAELIKLDEVLVPKAGAPPSAPILNDILLRTFELRLQKAALRDRVAHMEGAVDRVQKKLDTLPEKRRRFTPLNLEVNSRKEEIAALEATLTDVARLAKNSSPDFAVISPALPAKTPAKSSAKMIAIAVILLGGIVICGGTLLRVAMHKGTRSLGEVDRKLNIAPLGEVADRERARLMVRDVDAYMLEGYRHVARRLRAQVRVRGARILFTGAGSDDGVSSTVWGLAEALAGRGERILILDAHVREAHPFPDRGRVVSTASPSKPIGLGEYLAGTGGGCLSRAEATDCPAIDYLPGFSGEVNPDLLGSERMRHLLKEASENYGLVLIDAPSVLAGADTGLLAERCHHVVMVVRAARTPARQVKLALQMLDLPPERIAGAVLNAVHPSFAEKT